MYSVNLCCGKVERFVENADTQEDNIMEVTESFRFEC